MGKLPFEGRIFWVVLIVVAIVAVIAWYITLNFTSYTEMIGADWGGSIISGILLSYLIHLWLLPAPYDDEDEEFEDEESD